MGSIGGKTAPSEVGIQLTGKESVTYELARECYAVLFTERISMIFETSSRDREGREGGREGGR